LGRLRARAVCLRGVFDCPPPTIPRKAPAFKLPPIPKHPAPKKKIRAKKNGWGPLVPFCSSPPHFFLRWAAAYVTVRTWRWLAAWRNRRLAAGPVASDPRAAGVASSARCGRPIRTTCLTSTRRCRTRSACWSTRIWTGARTCAPGAARCAAADSAAEPRVPRHGGPDPRAVAPFVSLAARPADDRLGGDLRARAHARSRRLRLAGCLPSRGAHRQVDRSLLHSLTDRARQDLGAAPQARRRAIRASGGGCE